MQVDSTLLVQTPACTSCLDRLSARAAEFLLRRSPLPRGLRHLQEYRELFLETYGEQAEVPLLDLLSPENGLGTPTGYQQPPGIIEQSARFQDHETGPRDQGLLRLLDRNAGTHSVERWTLMREIQQQLERWSPTLEEAPLSLDSISKFTPHLVRRSMPGSGARSSGVIAAHRARGVRSGAFMICWEKTGCTPCAGWSHVRNGPCPNSIFAELSISNPGRAAWLMSRFVRRYVRMRSLSVPHHQYPLIAF